MISNNDTNLSLSFHPHNIQLLNKMSHVRPTPPTRNFRSSSFFFFWLRFPDLAKNSAKRQTEKETYIDDKNDCKSNQGRYSAKKWRYTAALSHSRLIIYARPTRQYLGFYECWEERD